VCDKRQCILQGEYNNSLKFIAQKTADKSSLIETLNMGSKITPAAHYDNTRHARRVLGSKPEKNMNIFHVDLEYWKNL
jgi:hypothetical protein